MSAALQLLVLGLDATSRVVVGWRCVAWRGAAAEYERVQGLPAELTSKAARLAALRAQPAVSGFGARPDQDVIQLVNGVLDLAGLPAGRLRCVQSEPDRAVVDDSDGRRAATFRLALKPVTVQELGSLLAAWRNGQQ